MNDERRCWHCGKLIGRAAAVRSRELETGSGKPAVWHRSCWSPWVTAQGFKGGRAPKSEAA